ncbi:hemolysin activation/secretion protein [Rubidibacter lacunae KORDI 51-2]|uniref:Hemolysin activation/secretion protein n=1 Tax=Rubidibacter lacunae KORDI 51-2 TaxID=582515 RepID=U5DFC5_9CHRO|nr:hemolysin activation/secretion protein [Rubidibacter lacunae KORDI 51-2]
MDFVQGACHNFRVVPSELWDMGMSDRGSRWIYRGASVAQFCAPFCAGIVLSIGPNREAIAATVEVSTQSLAAAVPVADLTVTDLLAQVRDRPQERFLQQQQPQLPAPLPEADDAPDVEPPVVPVTPPTDADAIAVEVVSVEVIGSTVFEPEDFAAIVEPLVGTTTRAELIAAADAITALYIEQGYLTSRAVVVEATLPSGMVEIRAIEGGVEEIIIEGTRRLDESYVRSRIALDADAPLNVGKLEDRLRVLRLDPIFENIEASLRAGEGFGQSIIDVRILEADRLFGSIDVNNYSPPSIGSEQFELNFGVRNFVGAGDYWLFEYDRTFRNGAESFDIAYRVPLNPRDGTLQLRGVVGRNAVVQDPFDDFEIEGDFELVEASFRQPLIRTPRQELALTFGFTYQNGQTFVSDIPTPFGFGPDEDGMSSTSVFNFGQEYVRRSPTGAWALRSQFAVGTGLFGATTNDQPIPDSRFFSWLGQAQRVQTIGNRHLLIAQLDMQLTPDSLLPSQQFVIGGGQSVRGYRENVLAADGGVRLSLENRITVALNDAGEPVFQIAPFFDAGAVFNAGNNPNDIGSDTTAIAAIGTGFLWQPIRNLDLRLDYGVSLVDIDAEGDNIQDDGLYFSIGYGF